MTPPKVDREKLVDGVRLKAHLLKRIRACEKHGDLAEKYRGAGFTEALGMIESGDFDAVPSELPNCGHGWVHKNASGIVARCGGPGLCKECKRGSP